MKKREENIFIFKSESLYLSVIIKLIEILAFSILRNYLEERWKEINQTIVKLLGLLIKITIT